MCPGPTQARWWGVIGGEGGLREVGGDRGKKEGGRREKDRNNSRQGQTEARPQCASAIVAAVVWQVRKKR